MTELAFQELSYQEKAIDMIYIMINNWIIEAISVQMTNKVKKISSA